MKKLLSEHADIKASQVPPFTQCLRKALSIVGSPRAAQAPTAGNDASTTRGEMAARARAGSASPAVHFSDVTDVTDVTDAVPFSPTIRLSSTARVASHHLPDAASARLQPPNGAETSRPPHFASAALAVRFALRLRQRSAAATRDQPRAPRQSSASDSVTSLAIRSVRESARRAEASTRDSVRRADVSTGSVVPVEIDWRPEAPPFLPTTLAEIGRPPPPGSLTRVGTTARAGGGLGCELQAQPESSEVSSANLSESSGASSSATGVLHSSMAESSIAMDDSSIAGTVTAETSSSEKGVPVGDSEGSLHRIVDSVEVGEGGEGVASHDEAEQPQEDSLASLKARLTRFLLLQSQRRVLPTVPLVVECPEASGGTVTTPRPRSSPSTRTSPASGHMPRWTTRWSSQSSANPRGASIASVLRGSTASTRHGSVSSAQPEGSADSRAARPEGSYNSRAASILALTVAHQHQISSLSGRELTQFGEAELVRFLSEATIEKMRESAGSADASTTLARRAAETRSHDHECLSDGSDSGLSDEWTDRLVI